MSLCYSSVFSLQSSVFSLKCVSYSEQSLRIDRWLWSARIYKTRGLATTAVIGGKVRLNGQRAKPSRPVRVGDKLAVTKGIYEIVVTVVDIPTHRGPAREASQLYEEHPESIEKRQQLKGQLKLEQVKRERPRRPDKRQRRRIRAFSGKGE